MKSIEQKLNLVFGLPPSVNHYLAYRAVIKGKKPIATSYKTSEAVKYQDRFKKYVIDEVVKQSWHISENKYQHYYMDTVFYFPRIDMDANNYFKVVADAITDSGCVWIDDNQLCERVQGIYYDSEKPRIEMIIYPVEYIGVFGNASQLDEFISNCVQCKKYKDGKCSLLCNALHGRIQSEISIDYVCNNKK